MPAIARNGLVLALCAALAAAVVGMVQFVTRDRIADERHAAEQKSLLALLPFPSGTPLQLEEKQTPADPDRPGWEQPQPYFIARRDGRSVGVILPVTAPQGYGGAIRLLAGIDAGGRLVGLRVLSHRETTGLGDRIEPGKSPWLRQFEGRSLQDTPPARWAVKKEQGEFDQLTGATITSRAAISALRETLEYFAAHRAELLGETTTGATHGS